MDSFDTFQDIVPTVAGIWNVLVESHVYYVILSLLIGKCVSFLMRFMFQRWVFFMFIDTNTMIFLFQIIIRKGRREETHLTEDIVSVWQIASSLNL